MTKRNIEEIRRKNLEDNQLFFEKLGINNIRNDFVNSARSICRKTKNTKNPIEHQKIEYSTRYNQKVKSGEIPPHVPEWQREIQRKLLEKEQRKQEKEGIRLAKQRPPEPSKWSLFYKNNPKPYQRLFKPRRTKTDERIEQEFIEHLKQDN